VHDYFAWMLSVRRAGVTKAFRSLKDVAGVETGRGNVRVINRAALIEAALGSYGAAELEYQKLFGYSISKDLTETGRAP
jgi:DNA-binding transcriptional regulator YhcF (GntR family)